MELYQLDKEVGIFFSDSQAKAEQFPEFVNKITSKKGKFKTLEKMTLPYLPT
jgi:hypothetical protein